MAGNKATLGGKPHPDRHLQRISRLKLALTQLPAAATAKRAELEAAIESHRTQLRSQRDQINAALDAAG